MILIVFGMIITFAVSCLGILIGINLKNPSDWLFVFCGFLFGLLLGLTRNDWNSGFGLGIASAVLVIFTSATLQQQKQDFAGMNKKSKDRPNSYTKKTRKKSNASTKGTATRSKVSGKRGFK